jgi:hypothetical protein
MLFQSLRALCIAPGGPGSILNDLGAPVRSTRVSGRCGCGFQTDIHFANDIILRYHSLRLSPTTSGHCAFQYRRVSVV